jgi:hypothetical protein
MAKTIEDLFVFIALYSCVLFLVFFFANFKLAKTQIVLNILAVYLAYEFLTDQIAAQFYTSSKIIFFLYSLFTIIELALFVFCFYNLIKNRDVKKTIPIVAIVFTVFAIIYFLTTRKKVIDTIPIGIETLIIICYSCYYLYEQVSDLTTTNFIYDRYQFWIVSGMLMYLAGSSFIYIFANQVDQATRTEYWIFINAFITIKKLMFAIGLFVFLKRQKKSIRSRKALSIA